MKIKINNDLFYDLQDSLMVKFLLDDLKTIKKLTKYHLQINDKKFDKQLIKSYKTILKFYGVEKWKN